MPYLQHIIHQAINNWSCSVLIRILVLDELLDLLLQHPIFWFELNGQPNHQHPMETKKEETSTQSAAVFWIQFFLVKWNDGDNHQTGNKLKYIWCKKYFSTECGRAPDHYIPDSPIVQYQSAAPAISGRQSELTPPSSSHIILHQPFLQNKQTKDISKQVNWHAGICQQKGQSRHNM